jgi:hypothetical protein
MRASRPVGVTACAVLAALGLVAPAHAAFGIETFGNSLVEGNGQASTQAGSHPYAMTTSIVLAHHPPGKLEEEQHFLHGVPDADVKTIDVNLPQGLVINPTATPRCTESQLLGNTCPDASAVGVVVINSGQFGESPVSPVFNMVTPPDTPADFAINVSGLGLVANIVGRIRTGGDYGPTGESAEISQRGGLTSATITLWGIPSDASHDRQRGSCVGGSEGEVRVEREERERQKELEEVGGLEQNLKRVYFCAVERTGRALLTMPTSCTGPLLTTLRANSWQEPTSFVEPQPVEAPGMTGCDKLSFDPSLTVQPDTTTAGAASGLDVRLKVPQEEGAALAQANLKEAVVTLPAGMAANPAAANGLQACSLEQIGLTNAQPPSCPEASKIGTAEATTPLLQAKLRGSVYVAQQGANPFGSLLALYLVLEGSGVLVKLPGEVTLNPATGQITTRFGEDPLTGSFLPQQPVSELKMHLFGGPGAALVAPSACGTYTTASSLTPWSAPDSGPPATPNSSFEVNQECGARFSPSFTAGTEDNRAGAFSPLAVTFSRGDQEQGFAGVSVTAPPGLAGMLSSVALCEEPQAAKGECGPQSLIGHSTAGGGAGPDPVYVGGNVYLTGPYRGAPFGLSIVVPAIAGPFDLGTVVVRAAIAVDPTTAQVTVTSDPLPTILQGVPLDLRTVSVAIDRPGFVFNPTSCAPLAVAGTIGSTQGAKASVSERYQAAGCADLAFKPKFTVSTSGKTSRRNGASLDTKLTFPAGAQGTQANIRSVKVELPKRLPSRLTTLQKACLAATFEANPASCPAASVVGIVRASTPVLPVVLTGPVYFVSHGGEAFPNLVIVLQGDNVRLDVVASTFISKKGITTSTFKTVPDAPVSSFELYLPEGRYSALAANGNLCNGSLKMPTTFVAQNGSVFRQSTKIAVTGCPAATNAGAKKAARERRH